MYEESKSFALFGLTGFYYGLFIMLGAAAALALFAALCRRRRMPQGTAALYGALSLPIGLVCSRILFCLLDFRFNGMITLRAIVSFWGGGYSMVGALLGAALAGLVTAHIQKVNKLSLLDALTPALLLFMVFARLGEGYTELLGRSRSLTHDFIANSFLAMNDGYDGYLKTYLLEAVTAAILCCAMLAYLKKTPREGHVLFTGMLLLGCTQVLWESLRFDSHMRYSFISMQQILFACMFAAPMILFAARHGKKTVLAVIGVLVLLVGAVVALEFMIDRFDVDNLIVYALYVLVLCVPAVLGIRLRKRSENT